jgi:4-hydroxy-3-methylbut-2-enyl diphosphate reductase
MNKVKINLAKSAGFCFGVRRALDIAFNTAQAGVRAYMLGDIVHNEDVAREIEKSGIKKIKRLGNGKDKTLLIRAHGIGRQALKEARRLGYHVIDATCPMVREIHKIAIEMEGEGYKIIVIGDKKHDEVQGIIGQLKTRAVIIDGRDRIPLPALKRIERACVVVQSTQNMQRALEIVGTLKKVIPELKFFNTICNPTRIKQEEIKAMPLENDIMIIIGSKNSANTKRLYEISKSLNIKSYWVNSKKEIKKAWFKNAREVGVTAGASTPESNIHDIIKHISLIAN